VAGADELDAGLRDAIDEAAGLCWLSPISLWEAAMLAAKGRMRIRGPFDTWSERALAAFPVRDAVINAQVVRTAVSLELRTNDPADHLIAATAVVYDLTLVTADRALLERPSLSTLGP